MKWRSTPPAKGNEMAKVASYRDLLNQHDAAIIEKFQERPPVNVVGLAAAFGLKVYHDDLKAGVSGKIIKDPAHGGTSGYSIIINSNEAVNRQRFTIAHEIGHYLLHRDRIGDGLTDDALYRSGLSTLEEVRANRLAADILMPFALIENAIKDGKKSVEDLASVFRVSTQAMSVRLEIPS
jgi:predicted transcriptional regulator